MPVAPALPAGRSTVRLKPISFSVIGTPNNKIAKEVSVLLDLEMEQDKNEGML